MFFLTEIRQELRAIYSAQQETAAQVEKTSERVEQMFKRIFVNNGQQSIIATVESVQDRVEKLEQAVGMAKQNQIELWHGILLALVSVALGSVAGAGWQYYRDLPNISTPTEEVQRK